MGNACVVDLSFVPCHQRVAAIFEERLFLPENESAGWLQPFRWVLSDDLEQIGASFYSVQNIQTHFCRPTFGKVQIYS